MIELKNIRKAFNQGRDNEFHALNGIDLQLPAQRVTALRGPSGSGKTTLLSIIGCLSRPTSGRVRLKGQDISGLPERFLTDIRRQTFGFVFQQFNLIRGLTALENVMLPAYPLGRPYRELRAAAQLLLERFGISDKAGSRIEWLSGGEAQRTALARALINDPALLIADEPTAHLDSARSQEVLALLGELALQGRTIFISSHDPLVFAAAQVKRVIALRDGQIAGDCRC